MGWGPAGQSRPDRATGGTLRTARREIVNLRKR